MKIRFGRREVTPLFDLVAWEALEEKGYDLNQMLMEMDAHKPWEEGEELTTGEKRSCGGRIWQTKHSHKATEKSMPKAESALWIDVGEDNAAKRKRLVMTLATTLVNNALEAEGKTPDVTETEMKRGVPPKRLADVRLACVLAINKGMRSDYEEDEAEETDVVLEELAKKQNPDG